MHPKPKSYVLWGFDSFTKEYIDLLMADAGLSIDFIVDANDRRASRYNGISVISPAQYKAHLNSGPNDTSIVITDQGRDFHLTLSGIVEFLGDEAITVLHPSFIVDHVPLTFDNKALVIGCNRSGSTLLFTIIKNLLERQSHSKTGYKEHLCERLAKEHFSSLKKYLDGIFRKEGMTFSATGATSFKNIEYWGGKRDAFFFMSSLASYRFLFDRVHRTYSVPNQGIIDLMGRLGYRIFSSIRNPLDIIVSNAFELENVFFHIYPDEIQDHVESDLRLQYGLNFLSNLEWFEHVAALVKKYMQAHLEQGSAINLVKYEDLITGPVETIKKISEQLNADIDEASILSLWETIGFKPLTAYKAHLFRPGRDKWKQFFTKGHMSILKRFGYQELTRSLGYAIDFGCHTSNNLYESLYAGDFVKKLTVIRDAIFSLQFNMPRSFEDKEITCLRSSHFGSEHGFATNDAGFLNIFTKVMRSEIPERMLNTLSPRQVYSLKAQGF